MFDDNFDKISFRYFNTGAVIETETYADRNVPITQEYVMRNHGISEALSSLIKNGIEINSFDEFDCSPYNCFKEAVEFRTGMYRIKYLDNKIPMVYAVGATK
ncbi:MAG: hypothetical protein WD077_03640 [Bacteroidia bacterium]